MVYTRKYKDEEGVSLLNEYAPAVTLCNEYPFQSRPKDGELRVQHPRNVIESAQLGFEKGKVEVDEIGNWLELVEGTLCDIC